MNNGMHSILLIQNVAIINSSCMFHLHVMEQQLLNLKSDFVIASWVELANQNADFLIDFYVKCKFFCRLAAKYFIGLSNYP